jgi:hypothetical protein
MEFTYFNMALTLFLVAISKYVGKNVRSRGPIACEEMPKGSRPKETNPINQDAATCDFAFAFSWTGPETFYNFLTKNWCPPTFLFTWFPSLFDFYLHLEFYPGQKHSLFKIQVDY